MDCADVRIGLEENVLKRYQIGFNPSKTCQTQDKTTQQLSNEGHWRESSFLE